jgi:vitamin K-dependent gamma-carboxylase-like protein
VDAPQDADADRVLLADRDASIDEPSGVESAVRRLFVVEGSPIDLAVIRVVFFTVALFASVDRLPEVMAGLPSPLRTMPAGSGWLFHVLPPSAALARVGTLVLVVAALAALLGWHARAAAATWAIAGVWVLGVPQLYGKVDHHQHLIWLAALLAASPCADVLSLDALRRRARPPDPAVRYGLPIRVSWLLVGLIYFFAGFWKLATQGPSWASPTNLRLLLHFQWAAGDGFVPLARLDRWPVVLVCMGVGTLVFELAFVFVVFTRRRPWAVATGLAFHLGTFAFLDISFTTLMASYVVFIPWAATLGLDRRSTTAPPPPRARADRSTVAIAAVLLGGVLLAGASQTVAGWPFASYPTFADRLPDRQVVVQLQAQLAGGGSRQLDLRDVLPSVAPTKILGLEERLLQLPRGDRADVLRALHLDAAVGQPVRAVSAVASTYSTDPDHRRLLSRRVLATTDVSHRAVH